MYANQGKPSDYEQLNKTVDLRGTIAIVRYGGAGRAAKVSCMWESRRCHHFCLLNEKNFFCTGEHTPGHTTGAGVVLTTACAGVVLMIINPPVQNW